MTIPPSGWAGSGFVAAVASAMPLQPVGSLSVWVGWLVDTHELWGRIPNCWERHPGVVAEMAAARDLLLRIDAESDGDVAALSHGHAEWYDYFGRILERLAHSPARDCVAADRHREPTSWDREDSVQRRKMARSRETA